MDDQTYFVYVTKEDVDEKSLDSSEELTDKKVVTLGNISNNIPNNATNNNPEGVYIKQEITELNTLSQESDFTNDNGMEYSIHEEIHIKGETADTISLQSTSSVQSASSSEQRWRRERFLTEILKSEQEKSTHLNVLPKDKYLAVIQEVEEAEKVKKKTPLQQRRLKRFNVLEVGGIKKLVARNQENGNIKYYLSADELYDVIDEAHVAVGHAGRDRMMTETSKNFANVTKEMIGIFLSMCEVCQENKTKKKRELVSKPILYSEMNSRCQVDFIDFHTKPDGKFKFVMIYQDHLTKFVLLRPLESKKAEVVAYHLNDIFLTIGAPCILQSDNGRSFVNHVISELTNLWPELKIVQGKPRHNQSQDSVEGVNQDIENMLSCWLKDNQTTKWSEGLRYVQFEKNRKFHSSIKQSPYKAMFGIEPRVGLSTTSLPSYLLKEVRGEEDLQKLFEDEHEDEKELPDNILETNNNPSSVAKDIQEARTMFAENFEKQAKKMKTASDRSDLPVKIGDNVIISIPGIPRNVVGIVLQINDDGFYKIGITYGVLQKLYCRTEFDICEDKFLNEEEVDQENEISLRTAAITYTRATEQCFFRCNCTKKCTSKKCTCKRNSALCSSDCHQSMPCNNKEFYRNYTAERSYIFV